MSESESKGFLYLFSAIDLDLLLSLFMIHMKRFTLTQAVLVTLIVYFIIKALEDFFKSNNTG